MTYTVWHNGRLLGESPLDFIRCMPKLRTGFLHPTPLGDKLLPVAGGTCRAANALHRAARKCSDEERQRLPEYSAFEEACEKSASFRLVLRGPDGAVIPTEYVAVRDFGFLDQLGHDAFDDDLEDEPGCEEAQETLASMGLDDWNGAWTPETDKEDGFWYFDELELYEAWRPREERDCERRMSRYQLQVELIDESSIP
ncbi:MAG: hypothetical protein ACRENU_00955 [Gemmatimonadaceae bacterium]